QAESAKTKLKAKATVSVRDIVHLRRSRPGLPRPRPIDRRMVERSFLSYDISNPDDAAWVSQAGTFRRRAPRVRRPRARALADPLRSPSAPPAARARRAAVRDPRRGGRA